MSSNFCSKAIDWTKYGVVYAGAQKNVGPAGVTIVIVRKDLMGKHRKDTPLLCEWEIYSKAANTFHNTPVCWSIYMCGLNIEHMLKEGGISVMADRAKEKSDFLYNYIDKSDYYSNNIQPKFRSRMNLPFRVCCNPDLEAKFLKEAKDAGFLDLGGHRSVGGCRASIYNAMPLEGVKALCDFMEAFKTNNPKPASE
jgi:phosphoserine aminotransferase